MSFLATLYIDNDEYNVLEFNVNFKKGKNTSGKPTGESGGGIMKLKIEATHSTKLLAWMLNSKLTKDGRVVFYRTDAMSKMKELTFKKSFCIDYDENFISTTEVSMIITMELVAQKLIFGEAKYLNDWFSNL